MTPFKNFTLAYKQDKFKDIWKTQIFILFSTALIEYEDSRGLFGFSKVFSLF